MIADGGPGRFGGFEIGDEIYVFFRDYAVICYTFGVDDVAPELLTEQYNRDRHNLNGLNQGACFEQLIYRTHAAGGKATIARARRRSSGVMVGLLPSGVLDTGGFQTDP